MERPRQDIRLERIDQILEIVGIIGLALLIGLPIFFYGALPDVIPRHYNAVGQPNGYSEKGIIWALPAIGLILYLGLSLLNRYPHKFNYPQRVTKENAARQYKNATRMLRMLNCIIAGVFVYITYSTIRTALGKQNGLGDYFLPTFLALMFGTIGYFLYKLTREK